MISNFLHYLYHLDIYISVSNEKLRLKYKNINKETKLKIKQLKPLLIKRLKENDEAIEKGFIIYRYGDLYEFRYGLNSFLFIERLDDQKASAWRANYRQGDDKPYKVKLIARNVPFNEAFEQASSFINWLYRMDGKRSTACKN
ncbi:hypothetical protein BKP35_18305 [Anaerobacillus arseniciselenatis]|uniref:Uncharacterized protein n=1 Tax=Anaerobacillus arseniciselenatis TaxID=85682 RepID=A0A1S2L580_9BACI|nr:hypothetical protein [Anaerobacillus arseniciselenatis]OIJ07639.1 hypothetical protein BKP35_18305 [Anaerobacillus arseniciselenatis]